MRDPKVWLGMLIAASMLVGSVLWAFPHPAAFGLVVAWVAASLAVFGISGRLIRGNRHLTRLRSRLSNRAFEAISLGAVSLAGVLLFTFAIHGQSAHEARGVLLPIAITGSIGLAIESAKRGYLFKRPPPELMGGRQYGPLPGDDC